MKLTNKDNIQILKHYKKRVPLLKKTKKKGKRKVDYKKTRKMVKKLLSNKICKCIKSVKKSSRHIKEPGAIAICNKNIIQKKGLKLHKFKCLKGVKILTRKNKKSGLTKTRKKLTLKKQKGGKLFGDGAFGLVYGNPRLPCVGESEAHFNDTSFNEVSKVFKVEEYYTEENESIQQLLDRFDAAQITELKKYCVMPINACELDCVKVEPSSSIYKAPSYMLSKEVCGPTFSENIINYPSGKKSLDNIYRSIKRNSTFELFKGNLTKLLNICRGIQFLQNHNIIHGDIKDKNTIAIDGTFKIIDMADARSIIETNDVKEMKRAYMYFTWPSYIAWTDIFDPTSSYYKRLRNNSILSNKYSEIFDYNELMIKNGFYGTYSFLFKEGVSQYYPDLTTENINEYNKLLLKLQGQKLFIPNVQTLSQESLQRKINLLMRPSQTYRTTKFYEDLQDGSEDIKETITRYNKIFKKMYDESPITAKLDLFKRADIYSLGILLFQFIRWFINFNRTILTSKELALLIKFIFIGYSCCIQLDKVIDINLIEREWSSALNIYDETKISDKPEISDKTSDVEMSVAASGAAASGAGETPDVEMSRAVVISGAAASGAGGPSKTTEMKAFEELARKFHHINKK